MVEKIVWLFDKQTYFGCFFKDVFDKTNWKTKRLKKLLKAGSWKTNLLEYDYVWQDILINF